MDYKNYDIAQSEIKNYELVINGQYDQFQVVIDKEQMILIQITNVEQFEELCKEFERIFAFFKDIDTSDDYKKLGIQSKKKYFEKLHNLLYNLSYYIENFQQGFELKIREYAIIQKLCDYIIIGEEETQCDQKELQFALFILSNCVKASNILCKQIIDYGVLTCIIKCFKFYNKNSRYISYQIFFEVFSKKKNYGQLGFIEFVFELAKKYITLKKYNKDSLQTSLVSQILFSLNEYPLLSAEEDTERQCRHFILNKASFIFEKQLISCYNSALKGLCDLVAYGYVNDPYNLTSWTYEFVDNECDEKKISYIVQLLKYLYMRMPEENADKYYAITKEKIPIIIDLFRLQNTNNLYNYLMDLYLIILHNFPQLLDLFSNEIFLGYLFDSIDTKSYNLSISGLDFASKLLTIPNKNFVNAFFSHAIANIYIETLVSIESTDDEFTCLFKGLVCALDQNQELVVSLLQRHDAIEDLIEATPNEEGKALLNYFMKKVFYNEKEDDI